MPRLPRLGLARVGAPSRPGGGGEVNAKFCTDAATEIGVRPGSAATQPMIEMQGDDALPPLRPVRP